MSALRITFSLKENTIISIFLILIATSCAQKEEQGEPLNEDPVLVVTPTAKEVIKAMAEGFKLGNTFENGKNTTTLESVKPIIDLYYNSHMKSMRIPTTWMDRFTSTDHLADGSGNLNVNNTRFKELVKVIDYAISRDMYVVLNTHHEQWLKRQYDGSESFDTKFGTLWTGIANYFKDYDYHLIFEILNEPSGKLGEWGDDWPDPTDPTALYHTRKLNEIGYNAIRATGGNNATRLIMVATNGEGTDAMIEKVYPDKSSLPGKGTDPFVAIQVHSYNPWAFCGQTGSNSAYPGDEAIANKIKKVGAHSRLLGVPVNYGEFGVGRETNADERNTELVRGYYRTFASTALSEDMSYNVWDDRGWFGLVSKDGSHFVNEIVPAMLGNL
ncbi:MAG: glycoside hydrolase family 5 protein [Cyclobacteriaceae bacterium]|nr:glycoside hydrolase family 5 protein [Cyclobacteriaceae bacterium]